MSDTQSQGGFAGDPAAALDVAGTSGCCGNPPQATLTRLDSDPSPAATGSPCCGTTAEATESGSCCGTPAKAVAVASGTGCCE